MWDQKKVNDYSKGVWVCFDALAKRQQTVELVLPKAFPLYREDDVYDCASLARWFYEQAKTIGQRFDKRNGSDYFEVDLARARACAQ